MDPRGWPVGDSVHAANSDINRQSRVLWTHGLPDASPEMEDGRGVRRRGSCGMLSAF